MKKIVGLAFCSIFDRELVKTPISKKDITIDISISLL